MSKTKLSAEELLELFNKQWADTHDLMKITGNCYQTCAKDRKNIEEKIKSKYQNKRLPRFHVPMEEVVDYFNININYLKKISNIKK